MIVDLGCGLAKRGDIGIDISPLSHADIICNLGFEPIPLDDEYADQVVAHHFVEHLPQYVYYYDNGQLKLLTPVIFLFNEVYRILKPGGSFEIRVPEWNHPEMYQDPTHKSIWSKNSFQYFHKDCFGGLSSLYGVTSTFKTLRVEEGNFPFEIYVLLQKE